MLSRILLLFLDNAIPGRRRHEELAHPIRACNNINLDRATSIIFKKSSKRWTIPTSKYINRVFLFLSFAPTIVTCEGVCAGVYVDYAACSTHS